MYFLVFCKYIGVHCPSFGLRVDRELEGGRGDWLDVINNPPPSAPLNQKYDKLNGERMKNYYGMTL